MLKYTLAILLIATSADASFSGRVAVSSDGNRHDCDDLFSSAVSVALLAKTNNQKKLVYYGYNDHVWSSGGRCGSVTNRNDAMKKSTVDTAKVWGGFDLSEFVNVRANPGAAVKKLTAEINKSTSSNRLWIIAAGPMEMIGRALAKAEPSRRKYVTVVSHSAWNDDHADDPDNDEPRHSGWTWDEIGNMSSPPARKHLPDQNGPLMTGWSTYDSWKSSSQPRMRWLWDRSQNIGLSWPDCSDTGMVYWLVTGRADERMSASELKAIFAR
jgi:hypothetical protein